MKQYFTFLSFLIAILTTISIRAQDTSPDLDQMVEWITGEFTSAEQAGKDKAYKSASLNNIQIWPNATNGAWIYSEESLNSDPDNPIQQRVFFISEITDSEFSIDVYNLPNKENYIGAWRNPETFSDISVFDLRFKDGCTLFLFYDGFQYAGATNTGTCPNDTEGATYTTSSIILVPDEIHLWDRGYDMEDKLKWGSEKGPYIYKNL